MFKPSCIRNLSFLSVFIVLLSLFSGVATADSKSTINRIYQQVQDKKLWQDIQWHNLLHYEQQTWPNSNYESEVDDPRFFNAKDGKVNPESELLETIVSFYTGSDIDNQHPQCRFVARFNWLQKQLPGELTQLPKVQCADYKEWRDIVPSHKVTLIFPAYHLNSPSSMFGHTLLRLDKSKEANSSDWLSMGVNFGANVRSGDNSLFYAFKGLSGGYSGFFIVEPYFRKIQEYNQKEKRDIWEYPLNFTPEETNRMVEHLWELKEIEFDYYFFDENCSYRLLELLEVARPGIDLTSEYGSSVIPVDTVRSIKRADLIVGSQYRPSQVTVLENLVKQIKPQHRHYIQSLSNDASGIETEVFQKIDETEQRKIITTAYKYLRYKKTGESRDDASVTTSFKLLLALSKSTAEDITTPVGLPARPENGHLSKRTNINLGRENKRDYIELGVRFAFHSFEDNLEGFLQGAQINMGNINLRSFEDDSVKLQRFDVVDIFSLTPRSDLFDPLSWKIYTGLERQLTNGKNRLVAHVTGGAGVSYEPFDDALVYGLLIGRLERNRGFERSIETAIGINAGVLYHFAASTMSIELSGEEFRNNEYRHRAVYSQNFALSQNHSIKLSLAREEQADIGFSDWNVAYQYYFF
jgi:Domain of unknown function (DUF4105)